jgi:hypothetical protein
MGNESILDAMSEFSGRTLLTIKRGADDLFKRKLNDGLMILVGSAVSHFDPAKEDKNAFVKALEAGSYFDGPGLELKVTRASWTQVVGWMQESFDDACAAGIDARIQISNIEGDELAHSQGMITFTASFSYLPEELHFIIGADRKIPLLTVAKKLQEEWIPKEEEDGGEKQDADTE